MEKRKSKLSKILSHFDALVDEKLTLEDNLKLLFNQIHPFVDHARRIENGRQKDLNEILKYELKILKKLSDINTDLEGFIHDKSVSNIQVNQHSYDCTNSLVEKTGSGYNILELSEANSEMRIPIKHQESFISEQSVSNEFPTEINESSPVIVPFEFPDFETKKETPEIDIESLRNCLKNFSAKLGLNQQSFSNMEDYYEKSSTSCIKEEQISPSPVVMPEVTSDVLEKVVSSEVEIPVRDTFIPLDELHSNTGKVNQCDESKSESVEMSCKTSSSSRFDSTTCIVPPEKKFCGEKHIYCPDINVNIEQKMLDESKTDCISSSKISEEKSDNLAYKIQTELHSTMEHCDLKFPDSSVLRKLNRYRSKKPNNTVVKTVQIPDISLKPTTPSDFLHPNTISSNNNPPLKKNKKKENVSSNPSNGKTQWIGNREREEDDMFYEPDRKKTPLVGDECAFSHIESPSEFYIHVNDEETALIDSLTEQINEYFNGSVSTYRNKQSACSGIGKFCFSYIPDYIGWFRVEVLDWYLDDDSMDVLVQLVDYGNKRKTSYKNLRKMVKELCDIPLLAIRCHFPLMYPYGSTPTNKLPVWPEIAVEALIGLSKNNGQQNMFKIMYALEESNSVAIDLLSPYEEGEGNTLGQILLDMGLAVQIFDEMNN